ncbi:MAG TPA: PQQ-dependent sugar dehydrogenase, partial [Arachidicoccus sp.]
MAFSLYALASCNGGAANSQNGSTDSLQTNSPEKKQPTANYKPAIAGQTRAPEVKTQTPIGIDLLDTTLNHPWGICNLPDGRLLISEKMGTMRIESLDGKTHKEIKGFPSVVPDGQGGLLDVNIDLNFAQNRIIYWDYSERQADSTLLLAIAKGTLSKDESKIENPTVIYRATPSFKGAIQYGSRILIDKSGNLFVSTGERSAKEIRMQA